MNKMEIVLDDGTTMEYEVILIYKSSITDKQYIVYTDGKKTINNENNFYICIFNNDSKTKLEEITDENEFNLIKSEVEKILGDKNE